ncbi:MAG: Asp-tRNA(Asn)/Glu-tRNA(Gln) amidotransferase subunit GatC [Firmicutes bacterium]|jgi:aspartyl-tRNA(Asn)/glutamyl-tRNA(Gln) amidotransferase subunit C|nr:Asp-tRNA(Asn)/Glu-tRNA(Gln) amidotransferase subunit GatC [Bacillota bacterium]
MDPYLITPELVSHIAELAALDLDAEEKAQFFADLNRILDHIKQLRSSNTEDAVEFQPEGSLNPLREDKNMPSFPTSDMLRNAPEKEGDFFKIPPVLE